jgi:elongation factor Ts
MAETEISAALVNELRKRTNGGMMDCKKALVEAKGDIDTAADILRKKGLAKAVNKSDRVASEGIVLIKVAADGKSAAIAEVNSETDFVSRGDDFAAFANIALDLAFTHHINDAEALNALKVNGETFEHIRQSAVAKLGENLQVRRVAFVKTDGQVTQYRHGERIAVLVVLNKANTELGKDIAMHIAASKPASISPNDIPKELIDKEREIFTAQAAESGKPADIVAKMVEGRIKKFLSEQSLLGQPFIKDPNQTVEQLLTGSQAQVVQFIRYEVGEGIEKKQGDFAAEVMAQVRGAE